jgi:hypothetical protein
MIVFRLTASPKTSRVALRNHTQAPRTYLHLKSIEGRQAIIGLGETLKGYDHVKEGGGDILGWESVGASYNHTVALTNCVTNGRGDIQSSNHELGPSSLLSTFPRVTKLANSIRESISSIVLDSRRDAGDEIMKFLAQRERRIILRAHRVFISLAHVISLRGGAFRQAPIIPRKSATRDSKTI